MPKSLKATFQESLKVATFLDRFTIGMLTFLNVPQLERQGADLQTKIEELQLLNQSLKENDKVKMR